MPNPSQLFLLADHIKLSLLERQRAISLNLEPNSQDGEISRSLESLREGIESVESEVTRLEASNDEGASDLKDQLVHIRSQYSDLSSQFRGPNAEASSAPTGPSPTGSKTPQFTNVKNSSPDLKQPVPQHPSSKSVRFMDDSAAAEDDLNRRNLFQPYRDSPSPDRVDTSGMSNQQVYDHHEQVMRDQDEQLDRLGESIGRQHQLSIQIGDELDGHVVLLDEMDGTADRHQSRLNNARRRVDKIRRKAGENWSMMTIIGLIIVLVILIVLLK
ncbi:syntaxin family protein [Aspergillus lucknowensis]|uniref:t-SNARE coiled-coil homology domain-containing protein n=1 Tax=Aspergillus lucknowensis TaxID=176173 RepID=A0ABR4LCJ4_9EURO